MSKLTIAASMLTAGFMTTALANRPNAPACPTIDEKFEVAIASPGMALLKGTGYWQSGIVFMETATDAETREVLKTYLPQIHAQGTASKIYENYGVDGPYYYTCLGLQDVSGSMMNYTNLPKKVSMIIISSGKISDYGLKVTSGFERVPIEQLAQRALRKVTS